VPRNTRSSGSRAPNGPNFWVTTRVPEEDPVGDRIAVFEDGASGVTRRFLAHSVVAWIGTLQSLSGGGGRSRSPRRRRLRSETRARPAPPSPRGRRRPLRPDRSPFWTCSWPLPRRPLP